MSETFCLTNESDETIGMWAFSEVEGMSKSDDGLSITLCFKSGNSVKMGFPDKDIMNEEFALLRDRWREWINRGK